MEFMEKTNLPQIVSDRIKQYIVEHELQSGDKLPSEKQLMDMLKVSRSVVREALKTLETLGILISKAGGGRFVEVPSLKPFMEQVSFQWTSNKRKMMELVQTRKMLELCAVELAIENPDESYLEDMEQAIQQMAECITENKNPVESDLAFHRALFKSTGNSTFFELSDVIIKFFKQFREEYFFNVENTIISLAQHKHILKQIRAKNLEEAKSAMKLHLASLDSLGYRKTIQELENERIKDHGDGPSQKSN